MTRRRALAIWALIVVASVLLAGTASSLWVKRQALDTDNWVAASDEVLLDPDVQTALATYVVDELYANVDVQGSLAEQLPENFRGLAGPIAAGLRQPATLAVEKLLATSRFQSLWSTANRVAHEKLVDVLEDRGRFVSTADGTVTLELGELVTALGQQLGLPSSVLDRIPPDAGNIVIARSDQLSLAQAAVKAVKWMGILLGLVVLALYGLAVFLAEGARRRTLRNIGWSVLAVGLFLAVTRRVAGNYVMSMLSDPTLRPAVKAVYTIGSQLLVDLAWSIVVWGLLLVLGCVLAGPTRPAVWARRSIAPVLNLRWETVAIGAVALYVILLLWAPTPALQRWPSALGLAVLLGLGLWALRRRTLVEFPDAEIGDTMATARSTLGSAWGSVTHVVRRTGAGGAGGVGGVGGGRGDQTGQLERLAQLHDDGKLDDAEFASAKARLLAG